MSAAILAVDRTGDEVLLLVIGAIAVMVTTGRIAGLIAVRLGQPAVVGEIVGGLMLGPSLLGLLPGDPSALLFPPDIQPYLRIIATLGLVIYMLVVGLEIDPRAVADERRAAVSISVGGVTTCFVLGAILAATIYSSHSVATPPGASEPVDVNQAGFIMFCGLAIAGSAFPILIRILDDRRLLRTRIGDILVASTVVDDLTVWMLAALVLSVAAAGSLTAVPLVLGGLAAFIALLFFVVRPLMARIFAGHTTLSPNVFAVVLIAMFAAAAYTTWLGVSALLGAFFLGATLPREGTAKLYSEMNVRLESLSVLVLLPVFFAVTGLGVDLTAIGTDGLTLLVAFIVVATAGKIIGAWIGCRLNGIRGRRAIGVGLLNNTRGLSELAILSIGRSLGLLDTTMFTVLVCAVISTTVLSGPIFGLVFTKSMIESDIVAKERSRLAAESDYRVLVLADADIEDMRDGPAIDVAAGAARSEQRSEVIVSRIMISEQRTELGAGFLGQLDAMTDSLDQLRVLTADLAARGVSAVPQSVFSHDLAEELIAQTARLRPHLVLLPGTIDDADELARRVRREAEVDVAVVHGRADTVDGIPSDAAVGAVRIGSGTEPDQALAVELGVRIAIGAGLPAAAVGRNTAFDALCQQMEIAQAGDDDAVAVAVDPEGNAAPAGPQVTQIKVFAFESTAGPRQLPRLAERLRTRASESDPG